MNRHAPLILGIFALQQVVIWIPVDPLVRVFMLVTYPLLIVAAATQWRMLCMRLIFLGALLNFLAIAGNGGLMPAAAESVVPRADRLGMETFDLGTAVRGTKSVVLPKEDIALQPLTDRLVFDMPLIGTKIFSIGDGIVFAGLLAGLVHIGLNVPKDLRSAKRHA